MTFKDASIRRTVSSSKVQRSNGITPGRARRSDDILGANLPTVISSTLDAATHMSGVNWTPTWPQIPPDEIRFEASSSLFNGLVPTLPPVEPISATTTVAQGRGSLSVLDLPNAANGYTLVVQYSDGFNGSADLRGVITVTVPEPSSIAFIAGLLLFCPRTKKPRTPNPPHPYSQ